MAELGESAEGSDPSLIPAQTAAGFSVLSSPNSTSRSTCKYTGLPSASWDS